MLIDCNASLGSWPFRRLRHADPQGMLELMDAVGITQAWVSPFEGLLYGPVNEANVALDEQLPLLRDRLVLIPTINPAWPGWEVELASWLDAGAPGVRLFPSYHGYSLDCDSVCALAQTVAAAGRMVQVALRVQDERHHHRLVQVPPADPSPLDSLAAQNPRASFVVLNASAGELLAIAAPDDRWPDNVYADISHIEGVGGVAALADQIGVEHILFGTHMPLLIAQSAVLKLRESMLSPDALQTISSGNALRLCLPSPAGR